MSEQFSSNYSQNNDHQSLSIGVKELVAIGFRHKRSMLFCFLAVFLGAVLVGVLMPTNYQANTKILVKRERVDPVISPGQSAPVMVKDEVTEEELNSEVELLESDDVMRQVAIASSVQNRSSLMGRIFGREDEAVTIAQVATGLPAGLAIEPMRK